MGDLSRLSYAISHTYARAHTGRNHNSDGDVMQEIKEQSRYCSMAAGRQAVTARRERDYWNTHAHNLSLTHTHMQTLRR